MKPHKSAHEVESVAYLLKSITGGWNTIYVSVPITTGPRFLDWFCHTGTFFDSTSDEYRKKHLQDVVLPNCDDARKRITQLRRSNKNSIIIDPTYFSRYGWTQEEYHYFWGKIIECCVNKVIFLDGWQYSAGCSYEFLTAVRNGIVTINESGSPLSRESGSDLVMKAIRELKQMALPTVYLERVIRELGLPLQEDTTRVSIEYKSLLNRAVSVEQESNYKDSVLDQLANERNIAQFVSFSPGSKLTQRFARIIGVAPNKKYPSPRKAIEILLSKTDDGLVNIRTYRPDQPKGGEFFYGKNDPSEVVKILSDQARKGLFTIVNETIDIKDGGVSGVALGNIMEFAPYETPKCVDDPDVCSLPRTMALQILENVYGFRPALNFDQRTRVEFSIHPRKRGLHKEHTIIWEVEEIDRVDTNAYTIWPNKFSQMIGDKVFGLLVADAIGLLVPKATVICRSIAPFSFGHATEKWDTWIRTCPKVRSPGKFPTIYGWDDPFVFMSSNDGQVSAHGNPKDLASLLAQEAVYPEYSGSLISGKDGKPLIEGTRGRGDYFMVGRAKPEKLPIEVIGAVEKQHKKAYNYLGPVEMEWVYDGLTVWTVQLHKQKGQIPLDKNIIYPGHANTFIKFRTSLGLDALRMLVSKIKGTTRGIILFGDVGITSHFGDLLRNAKIPSKIERNKKHAS